LGSAVSGRVIDAHAHLYSEEMTPRYWIDAMAAYGGSISGRAPQYVRERITGGWFDPSGDMLVSDMDAAGIEKSVVFVLDFGLYAGVDDSVSLARRYELFAAAVARHPDRLVLYGGIDPRRPDAAQFVQTARDSFGIQGVKIWPPAGARPDGSYCYRLYERCAELRLPVVVHTGQEIGPLRSECTRPMFVDQPANDFPELTFVLAHAGMGWWQEAAEIAWHHPNVYLDIAYWQAKYLRSPERFCQELRALISTAGKERVMFGTDWPAMREVPRVKHDVWVEVLRELPDHAPGGSVFEREEIDLLLGGAAAAALGI
jgi:predicted TIM-barrel fold metal-dependent hydrolase